MRLRVLDLCAGLGGASAAFVDAGDDVVRVDLNPKFRPTVVADVLRDPIRGTFDVGVCGFPCERFSVAGRFVGWKKIGTRWYTTDPRNQRALDVARACFRILRSTCRVWFAENPRGLARKVVELPRETTFYCAYGAPWMKPTDFWGNYTGTLHRPCRPHQAAPRGFDSGVNSSHIRDPAKRSLWPYELSQTVRVRAVSTLEGMGVA